MELAREGYLPLLTFRSFLLNNEYREDMMFTIKTASKLYDRKQQELAESKGELTLTK